MPTLLQLKDLLRALTPKLIYSGLTADTLGWQDYIVGLGAERPLLEGITTPGRREMRSFMNALKTCFRIGDESSVRVEACLAYVPFIIAVTKWILGKPPTVWGPDRSNWLDSDLDGICINASLVEHRFLVSIVHTIDSPEQLISVEGHEGPHFGRTIFLGGSIDITLWAKIRFNDLELLSALCGQILYFIFKDLVSKIALSRSMCYTQIQATSIFPSLPAPFGDFKTRFKAAQYVLGDTLELPTEAPDYVNCQTRLEINGQFVKSAST